MKDNSTDPYLRATQIGRERGIHRSTIVRWSEIGIFPPAVELAPGTRVWRKSVVDAWFAAKELEAQG